LDLRYWLITDSSKIIFKTFVKHVTCYDYLQADTKAEIKEFNQQLNESLNDTNFMINVDGNFDSIYLKDIDDDVNPGVIHAEDKQAHGKCRRLWGHAH
jgi:hypothetical protein